MSDKTIIAGGCSFVHSIDTWAVQLKEFTNIDVINVGITGAGNDLISRAVIHKTNELLSNGKKPEDLFVFVSLSGLERTSFLMTEDCNTYNDVVGFNSTNDNLPDDFEYKWGGARYWGNFVDSKDTFWAQFLFHTIDRSELVSKYYEYIYSSEYHFLNTLEHALRLQWFFKSHNIKYKIFTGWDILTYIDDEHTSRKFLTSVKHKQFQWDEKYESISNKLNKDVYINSTHLWDMIDWENFWVFNNDKVKYGGLLQWVQNNLPTDSWYRALDDRHPSTEGHREFCKQVIIPLMGDWYEENN